MIKIDEYVLTDLQYRCLLVVSCSTAVDFANELWIQKRAAGSLQDVSDALRKIASLQLVSSYHNSSFFLVNWRITDNGKKVLEVLKERVKNNEGIKKMIAELSNGDEE